MNWPAITRLDTISGHTFLPKLTGSSVVIDLGAHKGEFSRAIADRYKCTVFAVEASECLCASVELHPLVKTSNLAIAGTDGPIIFHLSDQEQSSSIHRAAFGNDAGTVVVEGVRLETFLHRIGVSGADLLKVDIEGAEKDLFSSTSDETLAGFAQISVEYHDFCGLLTSQDVRSMHGRLVAIGFRAMVFAPGNLNVLYVNQNRCRIKWPERIIASLSRRIRNFKHRRLRRVPVYMLQETADLCLRGPRRQR